MRAIICLATVLAFGASSSQLAAKPAAFTLNKTTWTFTEKDGNKVRESVDSEGNFIEETLAGKHVDHGLVVMKDGKACFTSAMTNEGQVCWTSRPVKIGHSLTTTSDKGEKLTVTRVAYHPLHMPK